MEFPTFTPWPTFTLAPTPVPTPSPVPTNPPAPTATPWPRGVLETKAAKSTEVPPVSLVIPRSPAPVPGAGLEDMNVFLEKQALLPFRGGDLPDYLVERDWDRMPPTPALFRSGSRYMLWVVAFDFSEAEPGLEPEGLVRWWSAPPGVEPLVMFEVPVVFSSEHPFFYHGLGRDDAGFWMPGFYRVEFLDAAGNVAAASGFEVRP